MSDPNPDATIDPIEAARQQAEQYKQRKLAEQDELARQHHDRNHFADGSQRPDAWDPHRSIR